MTVYHQRQRFPDSSVWAHLQAKRQGIQFTLEITPRCGLNCRHCYINRPAGDQEARTRELTCEEILALARQAVDLGALWCTLTGGDPLLRDDFSEIYLGLKRLGLLVYVYTNGTLITPEYARLFHDYPPRDLYITVYGATEETYERVTRRAGSYAAFRRGVELLQSAGVPVQFKTIALRSNLHELTAIAEFCHAHAEERARPIRFATLLHLRIDGDTARNAEILTERLTAQEIIACQQANDERTPPPPSDETVEAAPHRDELLLQCQAGLNSYAIGYDGQFRLCLSLLAPGTTYDLRNGTLREALFAFTPQVRALCADPSSTCSSCTLRKSCKACPAYTYLEMNQLDGLPTYFCELAQAYAREKGA